MSHEDPVLSALARFEQRLDKIERRLEPIVEFVARTNGVLSVARWVGFAGIIALVAFAWSAVTG